MQVYFYVDRIRAINLNGTIKRFVCQSFSLNRLSFKNALKLTPPQIKLIRACAFSKHVIAVLREITKPPKYNTRGGKSQRLLFCRVTNDIIQLYKSDENKMRIK